MEDSRKKLYDTLSKSYNLGTFEEFNDKMGYEESRKKLYDTVSEKYNLGDFDTFNQKMGTTYQADKEALEQQMDEWGASNGSFMKEYEDAEKLYKSQSVFGGSGAIDTPQSIFVYDNAPEYGKKRSEIEEMRRRYYSNPLVIKQREGDAGFARQMAEGFATEAKRVEQENPELARKAKAANAAALNPRGAMTGYITDDVKQYNEDRQNYETARRMAESAQDIYAAPSKYDDSIGVVNFLKGGRDVANKADFWTMGMVGIADNLNARDALMKVQEKLGSVDDLTLENIDSILTPSEKAIVTAFATNVMAQASRANDLSRGYQAGQGAMESLGFMAQFLLTQGLGSAAAKGASKGIAKAVSKGATDSMTKWLAGQLGKISSSTVKSATKSAAKGVVGTIESVVKASVMTPMIPQTWKTVSDEMLEINDAGKLQEASTAFWHGLGDAMIETWSENAGGMVEKILGVPLSAGKSVWNKALGKTDFGKWGANLTRTPAYNLMRQAGWNGFIAEMGEEFVGNTVRTVTGLDPEALQDFSTVDNLLVTAASFAPMTIIGLGTSAAQYGAAKKRATKAAEHLAQVMKGAGYTPEQIAFTLDDMNASTPVQLSQSLTPVVNQIAKDSGQGSYVFKAAMEYADAMARYRTLDGFYNREQAAQIEDARENIMANTGQQFWQTKEVADGVTTDNVRVITTKEGIRMFVTGESEDGMLAVVKENGEKRFITPDQLANTAGPIPEGEVIVSDESMSLNDFLRSEVVSKKKDAEQQRMSEEANAAIETIRQAARPGTQINLGTAEVPVIGNIVQQIPDGVVVQSEAGVSQLTWEEAGNAMNIAVKPMTDAEIEQQEIDAIEAERAAKEFERAKTEQEAVQAGATEIVSTEEAEDALPLPLKADGSVDQTALWNQSPERWARWNDDQRQDDGINSANYISSALARAQKDLDQTVKAYGNESDFDARASLESDITAKQERVNRLAALQQSYIPQEAMQEAQAEQTSVPAKPRSSQQLKEKQKSVERTLESEVAHLYELGLNNEEVAANLDAKIAKAQKDLEAQSKKAPLMEADAEAYIEKKRKYEEKMSTLQQEADFWSEAKEAVNNLRAQETQMPEAPSEVALESDPEPQNGVELAARELGLREGGIKLLWDSFEHHTGYGSSERSKFFGLFRTKAKGGMTIEQAGERLMELDRENNTGFFDQNDPNAGTNAILDALSDNDTIGQLRSYVARQRKAEAEREAKATYSSMNAYYEQTFGEKLEDTALYDEIRSAEILASGLSESEQQELNNIIFAEEISQYGTEGYQTEASGVYESEVAGNATNVEPGAEGIRTESVGVLQGAQSDNSGRDAEPEEGQRGSEGESSEQDALPSVPSGESATAVESSLDEDMPDFSNQIEQVREEVDTDPSEAQKKAGNYKMGHLHLDGYNITIENPKGSVRRGTDSKGNEWENTLKNDYGYIRGTEGVDGDHIDVYLSDNPAEGNVYVIDQVNPETREFDEHKVMYGFNSIDEAREAYLANFSEGWNGLGTITEVAKDEFKKWIDSSHRKTKPFSEYKSVKPESAQSSKAQLSDEEVTRKAVEFFTPGSKALALRERIDSWVSKLGVKVNVMESIDDVKNAQAKALIKKGGKVWGWFEPAAGEVYIYLPDFASLDLEAGLSEIDKTYIHEIVSHQGLRGLLGQEKYDELCDKLWESLTEEEKKDALARPGVNGDKRKAADEHIAYFSETINYESNPSAWDKIVSIVIDILKSIGIQVGITDSDLASLLRASYQKLATEAQTKPEKKSESKPKKTSKVKAEKAADEKIEDFGEKIGGARKDVARAKIRDSVKLSQKDLIELKDPDKILSRKNIIKYYADGAMTYEDAVKLLAMNMAVRGRDAIDRGVAMKKYRSLALAWESGAELVVNITDEDVQDRMNEFSERMRQAPDFEARTRASLEQFVLKVYNDYKRTYEALEYPEVYRNLKSAYIRYGDHDGKYWVVGGPSSYRGWPFPTLEQAVAKIEKIYPVEAVAKKPSESKNEGEKSSSILVTKDRAGYYRIKSRNIPGEIYLSGKMYSKKDAETFLAENYDKLVERENKLTEALLGSNIGMVEREGIDYRKGKDVTPKDFLDTFGFRGVEFGNWVPQVERQAYLNKTYDAIMDFCHIVGISPKAFSLGGRLGLAFGARGKSRALAHYEPLKEVINLTRMKGAGSLAHEWFHALDNYLAKQKSGNVSDMATDKKPAVRQEVTDALNAFVAAMNRLEYTRRSNRAGQYWGEVWERAARLFESYIYNELGGQNTVSPLLVKKDTLYVDQGEYSDDAWPYPSAEENVQMKPFFDNIFATLQEQVEKDGSVTLFRAEEVGRKQAQLDVINEANPMIDDYHVGIRNVEDIKTFDEVMEEARRESEKGGWSELASYPDISNDMLEDALETRRIVIYSSHPIANGVFVTPSYMQADEYSGMTGEVYSKDVSVDDIAWINTDEGQFASLNDAIQKYDGTPDNETSFRGVTPAMDAEYIAAVNRGDMETAQRMVNRAARMAGYDSSSEYQGSIAFNGATPSSNPYYESKEERKEAWENGDYEGDMSLGDYVDFGIDTHDIEWQLTHPNALRSASASGRTSILNLRNAVNSKDRKIKIYRAVDANIKEGSIRNGDWVTPSRSYALEHIYMQSWKKGRIIEQEVSIDDLWWDGNDINEWGYDDGKGYAYKDTKNNRKLLNAVTYDDNGNVIPLSKRFNPRKEDVRFRATEITPEVRDEMDRIAATAIIDGNYMLAPNGQPTKLTADQWAIVRTKNFINWFGDWINDPENASKVVDENGEPMVVYHGTGYEGNVFTSGFFASDEQFATDYGFAGNGFNSRVVSAFIKMANPRVVDADYANYDEIKVGGQTLSADDLVRETKKDRVYDGLIIKNVDERSTDGFNWTDDIIPFAPSQIKSATDNTGEFSTEEGDIRFRAEEPRTAPSKDEVPEIIDDLFEQADSSKNKVQRKIISSVTPRQLEEYRKKGILNVTADFVHSIENTALRHENKRHSGDNRTQQPLTKEEWHNILDVIENFDTVEKQKSRSGLDVIVYKKKNNDGTIYYVEEIRTGRKSLALTTAYKKRGDSSELMADALPQTSETTLDNTSFDGKDSDYLDNNNSYEVDTLFRAVTDKKLLDRLNSEPTIKVYRAMQLIDGKLYPPMSAKVDGKMREPIELGKWEQAEERPDLADEKGYFKLDKGNKTSLKARYNPYFHTSPTPLNDQFSSAQTRPELVTVEVEVPESELTSGYKAEKAKDSVGQMEWKAGVVQAKLSGTRTVILSRWDKPVRIVPDSEVADVIVDMFDGKDIVMPSNVVTPSLRAELEKRGVSFMETDNKGKPVKDTRFRATTGTPTEDIVENGLQLSVQNYARLAGDIFAALPENMRREVVEDTFRNGIDMQRAIMQIPTRLAEKDDLSEVEVEVAKMIAGKVQDALLADGVLMTRPLTTAEAIWMLYKHNNAGNDILSAARRSVVADNLGFSNGIIGGRFSNEDDIRFRASRAARADSAARMYNTEARLAWRRLQESWQDMNVSVDSLMRALETASGKAIQAFENIAMALNRLSSKNLADKKKFLRDKLMPLWEKVLEISDKFKVSIEDIERYMMLKHGLERNLVLAARDARNYYKEELEKELSRIDKDSSLSKSEKKAAKAKAEATYQRHLKNIENGTDSEYLENRKKDYGGLTSLYSDYADYGTREDYDTEEEYQEAAKAARTPKYKTLEEAENAAVAEVGSFEAKIGGLTMELWHKVNAATKDTLKHQYNHGMLTKEQYESVRDMFEYYVPLRGFKDNTVEDMYSYYGSGQHNDFAKPLQAAKGRKTEAESPLGWIGSMAESAIQMDNKNDAKLRLYYLAVNRPDNDLMKITETWYEWTGDYNAEGKKIFEPVYPTFSGHLSGDSMQAKMDAFDSMMEQQAMQGNAFRGKQRIDIKGSIIRMPKTEPEHVVNVKVAGKDYSILINGNPRAAQAINGLLNIDNADANGVYRGFRAVLRMMSALSTSYNPEFWISNFQRDMMYAFIGTSIRHDKAYTAEFAKNYIEAFKVISMLRKNKKGALGTSETESYYKEFSENGGVTGYTVLVNNAEYDKMLREFQKDQQKSDFIKKIKSGFEAVADFGEAIEQVSRFAAYMTSRKMGKGIEESVNEAKEITVNFNRKGSGKAISWEEAGQLRNRNGKPLNWAEKVFFVTASGLSPIGRSVYMFFNASIQGLSAAAKLARNNTKKSAVWAGIFLSMGMLNAVLHAMLDDDDDYLDMPEYEKRTNLLIGGNGVYFKWALPQEVRPFYAMADIFVNHAMGRAPHKNITEELASVFADLLPVNTVGAEGLEGVTGALMPSYVSPIYQVIINKDFKGAPIYREMPWIPDDQQKDVPAYTKAYSGTGSLYVNVSEMLNNLSGGDYSKAGAININPAVVEHIVEGYGGGTLTTANKVLKSLGMIAGTEDISFRSMPFLSRILTVNDDRYRNAHTTELYNYYKGISDQAKRSYNAYEKQRDGDKLSELMRSEDWKVHQIFLRYKKMLDYYDKQLKLASTEGERRTIMREQDAQRKRVIEEISRLR